MTTIQELLRDPDATERPFGREYVVNKAADRIDALYDALRAAYTDLLKAEQAMILANNKSENWRKHPAGIHPLAAAINTMEKALRSAGEDADDAD